MAAKKNSAPASPLKGDNGAPIVIEQIPIDALVPYEKNARSHPPTQIAKLAGSIREFGFIVPCVIDKDNVIVAGHGRVLGAKEAGLRIAPCIRAEHLSPAQIKAFRLADNRTSQDASWLDDILRDELKELQGLDFDLSLTGFDDRELQSLLVDDAELARAEETPEPPANPVTIKGDVWICGRHRVCCGDATSQEALHKVLAGAAIDMVFSDPPYGVSVVKDGMVGADFGVAKKGRYAEIAGDGTTDAGHQAIALCQALNARVQIYWGGNYFADKLPPTSCWLVWDKRGDTGIENTFADCELAWTNMSGPARVHKQLWNGMIREGEKSKRVHPTQKPVALAVWALTKFAKPEGNVLDVFLGSGTTLVAAETTGHNCYAVELSEAYVDVSVKRWQALSGQQATLEGDGRDFDEISANRGQRDRSGTGKGSRVSGGSRSDPAGVQSLPN